MKNLLLPILFLYSISSFALQEKDLNITGGIGVYGSRGLLGFSADKFLTTNHAVSLAVGLDFIGATSMIGYKYFSEKINNSNTLWDKCFFLFDCDRHIYAGPSLQYASGTALSITEGTNQREYKIDPKWLGLISIGFREIFKNNVTLDTEFSYRSIISGGKAIQTSGLFADDTKAIEMGFRSVGINVGIGYLF